MHITLVLTHDCNLACTYCYTGEKFRKEMDWETAAKGIDMAFAGWGDVEIGFFGGEPLIAWPMLVRVCEEARARAAREGRNVRFAVTTNATLMTPSRALKLAELGVEVTVSLDGVREAHDATRPQRGGRSSFDAAVRGARYVRDAGLPLEIIAVVAPDNVKWLGASTRFLCDLGARNVTLNPCYETPWSDEALALWEQGMRDAAQVYADCMRKGTPVGMPTFDNKLLAAAKGGLSSCDGCSAGDRELAIAPSGNFYPCARLVGEDRDDALVIGHIDRGIDRAKLGGMPRGPSDPACESCAEAWRCMASCMCANLAETGTTNMPGGVQCWYEQASARVADEIGAVLFEERCTAFLRWIYGRIASAQPRVVEEPESASRENTGVRRVRRLPVLREAAS